jgi:hypothetical protein
MHKLLPALAIAALLAGGCYMNVPTPAPPPPTSMTTWGPLGGMSINTGVCAGQITLNAGIASLSDPCFTGSTNVVLCTDTTAPNPVRCAAAPGALDVSGTGSDIVAYARVK